MAIFAVTVLVLALVTLIQGVVIYNRLVNLKHGARQAWSNIDVLLKQRHDEIPKLVETCKRYMQFEQATLEKVIAARGRVAAAHQAGDVAALGAAEGALRLGLGQLFAVAENYPQLKADETFRHLQGRITGIENGIADRRELYNASVNANNVRLDVFPDLFVARLFQFRPFQLLDFEPAQTADVDVRALFQT